MSFPPRRPSVHAFIVALGFAACPLAAAESLEIATRADAYLRARTEAGAFSGTVLIARGGKTVFVKGYGFANEASRKRNGPDTRYPIASITKTFTATLVLQQQRRGALSLSDPLCKFLVSCPKHWQPITVRHLLNHTAGIPDYAKDADFSRKMRLPRAPVEIMAEFRDRPLEFAPGAKYAYSNSNYILLGLLLEKSSGKSYEALLQESIFTPLDMRDSALDSSERVVPNRAIGYRPDGSRNSIAEHLDVSWLYSAGQIYSTVGDLLKWDRALEAGVILPRDVLASMWTPKHGSYGLGWQIANASAQSPNRHLVFHAGGTIGFAADFLRFPDEKVTIIVLANLLPIPLAEISRDLAAIVFSEPYSMPVVRRPVAVDPAIYDTYAGTYQLAPNVDLIVRRDGDRLIVQATGQAADVAIPESSSTFYSRISPVRISFEKNEANKVVRLVVHESGRDLPAARK